ncbi:glycosyltransferase family 4 protein, partial [bacterium]|nr:glycosyltransferase family 4 protein [candidate division CSSED10-310 bacterium]
FPSIYPEPFGIVGLEAMAAGRPVVAFDVGGVREWLKTGINGYCAPRGNTEAYTGYLRTLLSDMSLATELGTAGWLLLKQQYSHDRHIKKLEKTYERLRNL